MEPTVRLIKPVDRTEKPSIIAPIADREFWVKQRRALLAQVAAIEEMLGMHRQQSCQCQRVDSKQ